MRYGRGRVRSVAVVAAVAVGIAACSAPGSDGSDGEEAEQDADAPIEVWVDEVRTAGAEAFKDAHPELKVDINTIPNDPGYLLTNIALKNEAGNGWPDVVFLNTPEDVASLAHESFEEFAQPLNELIDESVLDGFAEGALDGCTFDGDVYCTRNDIGQTVLWYNKALMEDFGYEVPETWTEYRELGEKLGKEHAGYVIGSLNGKWGAGTYFSSSGCQTRDVADLSTVRINVEDEKCTRVTDVLEPLLDNGTVSVLAGDDEEFQTLGNDNKILMMPGPSWYGDFRFKELYQTPEGQLAAAPMPTWEGESEPRSGSVGGGAFVVSRHSKNLEAAAEFATWMTTDVAYQASQPTYPAFEDAAAEWGKAKAEDSFYAEDPFPAMQEMAPLISESFGWVRYANEWNETFNATVASLDRSKPLAEALADWGDRLGQAAEETDYQVER